MTKKDLVDSLKDVADDAIIYASHNTCELYIMKRESGTNHFQKILSFWKGQNEGIPSITITEEKCEN